MVDYLNELWKGIPLIQLLVSLGVVAGGTLVGLSFERVALGRLYHAVRRTEWGGDDIIIHSLRHVVTIWFALASIYFVILRRDIDQTLAGLFKNALLVIFTISIAVVLARVAAGFIRLYFSQVRGLPSSSLITNVVRLGIALLQSLRGDVEIASYLRNWPLRVRGIDQPNGLLFELGRVRWSRSTHLLLLSQNLITEL